MNKFTYAAISLIGAIPGGFLAYFSVMAMIDYFRDMTGMMRVVACVTTAASALMTVMPLGIVIFTKPKSKEEEEAESAAETEADEPAEASEVDVELGAVGDEDAEPATALEDAESEESVVMDTEGMFDDEGDEEPEEDAPKKKRKKDKKKKKRK